MLLNSESNPRGKKQSGREVKWNSRLADLNQKLAMIIRTKKTNLSFKIHSSEIYDF